jgi:hypothetical protein
VRVYLDYGQACSPSKQGLTALRRLRDGGVEVYLLRGLQTEAVYRQERRSAWGPLGINHGKHVVFYRWESPVAYLVIGSSNHTSHSKCSRELDTIGVLDQRHPETIRLLEECRRLARIGTPLRRVWDGDTDKDGYLRIRDDVTAEASEDVPYSRFHHARAITGAALRMEQIDHKIIQRGEARGRLNVVLSGGAADQVRPPLRAASPDS